MLRTMDLYMKACNQSKELHAMTDDERSRLQEHLKKIYVEIEKVCLRHNLRMCTAFGTVLGAVRHQGFIPWDDDMDLFMMRDDYEKFIHEYADELPQNLKIYAPNTKNGPIYRFAKVVDTNTRFLSPCSTDDEKHGVFVDIFPLEYAPKNKWNLLWRNNYTRMLLLAQSCVEQRTTENDLTKRLMCSSPEGSRTYKIRNFIGWLFSWRSLNGWYNRIANYTYYNKNTGVINIPTDGSVPKSLLIRDLDIYFPARKLKFEDIEVLVPKETEEYLVRTYGNWQCIPPVEDRWRHFLVRMEI